MVTEIHNSTVCFAATGRMDIGGAKPSARTTARPCTNSDVVAWKFRPLSGKPFSLLAFVSVWCSQYV